MAKIVVTLAQLTCQLHDKEANLKRMKDIVRKTKGQIVIFPELNLTGYMPRDDLFGQAETASSPMIKAIVRLAKDTKKDIVFGAPMKGERLSGVVYNSCLLAAGTGKLFRYDKMYLPTFGPFEEKVFFAEGKVVVVGDGRHARIGLMICYDMFFPELAKLETLLGAQILVNISAAPTTSRPFFRRVMPGRAVENAIFVAYSNMVGVHGSLVFGGGSVLYGPRGEEIVRAKDLEPDIVEAEIDLADIDIARRFRPVVRDSRPEILDQIGSVLRSDRTD
ncbi:MAG: carbon-nitrogen hydrolase family protein [Thermoplasmata archaeon]|nr:carbon-nitrogen hydrolase family protein [Thermoplasmata archaeon]